MTPPRRILQPFCTALIAERRHKRRVINHEPRGASALCELLVTELGDRRNQTGLAQQVQIPGDRDRVAGILQLAYHF